MTSRSALPKKALGLVVGLTVVPAMAYGQDAGAGGSVYAGTCVACHAENGEGAFEGVPNLADRLSKSDDELFISVSEGFESPGSFMAMPARGGNPDMTEQEVRDVIAYIRETFGE